MADTLQHGSITGNASVRQRISGEVVIGGKVMKELRFLPYSEFPEIGREETLYIDTDNNAMYYYDGSAYVALSGGGGGGTDNYNALSNKPSVNSVTLIGNKTSSELGLQELISDLSAIRSGATSGSTAVQPETLETALSEKQDAINDLDDIRSGASAGATAVQPSDMESALADKQDVISDLSTIRSGAASGATAVQPDDMETALSSKQDVISDLSDIRSGASAGATAVQPSDMETALSGKQDTISDLQTIRSGAALGATAVQLSDMETALVNKQDVISDLDTIRSGATAGNTALQPEDVDTLPTDGSSNPVSSGGTYNFVNSSIATNTAYFIGTFASVEELEAYSGTVTNNDYAFVTSTDSAGNTLYNRYKYNAATLVWSFEYAVNNTAFTTAQWAAIQSGMTSADKTKLDGIETGANKTVIDASPTSGSSNAVSSGGVHTALSGKQDTIADLSDIRSGASAGATAVQPSALNDYQTKLSGTNKLDPSYIDYDASHRAVSDTEKSTWNDKQDAISDLDTIRSGAAAGATALQQSDVTSTYSASGTAPINGTAVNAAIETLDVSSVGGSGKYISAISETDGKIEAIPTTFDTALSSSSTNNNAPTSKSVFDDQERQEVEIGAIANRGAKNLLWNHEAGYSETIHGRKFTVLSDGGIKIEGAASDSTNADFYIIGSWNNRNVLLNESNEQLTMRLSCTGDYGYNNIRFRVLDRSTGSTVSESGIEVNKDRTFSHIVTTVFITIWTTVTLPTNGIIVYPMIRPASITDSTFVPYAKTNREITIENESQQSEIDYAVNTGTKNLLHFDAIGSGVSVYGKTYTHNGITYTLNADMTVTATGTADMDYNSYAYLILNGSFAPIDDYCDGKHIVSGCPTNGSTSKYRMYIAKSGWGSLNETGSGAIIPDKGNYTGLLIACFISKGYAIPAGQPLVFKPMVRSAEIADPTFQPYALPNPTLTPAAIKAVDEGAKNRLFFNEIGISASNHGTSLTTNAITYTVNSDGTISVSGTASAGAWVYLYNSADLVNAIDLFDGNHIITLNRGSTNISLFYSIDGASSVLLSDGDTLPASNGSAARIGMQVNKNVAISGTATVCPMICTAADWAVSQKFVPYCPTNRELYESLQTKVTLAKVFGRGVGISNNDDLNTYQTLGRYCASNGTIAASLSNCPVATGFVLTVTESFQVNGGVVQTIESLVSGETQVDIYKRMRIYRNNVWSWGDWYKFEGTAVT